MRAKWLLPVGGVLMVIGCVANPTRNQSEVTFSSYPSGATISVDGNVGLAPKSILFNMNGEPTSISVPVTATWVSGATRTERMNLVAGHRMAYTFQRPNAPGIEADVQWAIYLQQKGDADDAALLSAFDESFRHATQPPRALNCTSTGLGAEVALTSCR